MVGISAMLKNEGRDFANRIRRNGSSRMSSGKAAVSLLGARQTWGAEKAGVVSLQFVRDVGGSVVPRWSPPIGDPDLRRFVQRVWSLTYQSEDLGSVVKIILSLLSVCRSS